MSHILYVQSGGSVSERQAVLSEVLDCMDEQVIVLHEKFASLQRFEVTSTLNASHYALVPCLKRTSLPVSAPHISDGQNLGFCSVVQVQFDAEGIEMSLARLLRLQDALRQQVMAFAGKQP